MAGQVLDVFEGDTLGEQVSDCGDPERVRRQVAGLPGVRQAALHHSANIDISHRPGGEFPGAAATAGGIDRPEERAGQIVANAGDAEPGFKLLDGFVLLRTR